MLAGERQRDSIYIQVLILTPLWWLSLHVTPRTSLRVALTLSAQVAEATRNKKSILEGKYSWNNIVFAVFLKAYVCSPLLHFLINYILVSDQSYGQIIQWHSGSNRNALNVWSFQTLHIKIGVAFYRGVSGIAAKGKAVGHLQERRVHALESFRSDCC